ncbi:MAG: hypothetical protein IPK16_16690 [Anaerolineales bacterium]|nr:hypothetical protein [Anaerolineales bacterium]
MATRTLLDDFDTLWHNYDLYQDLAAIPGESDERLWPGTGEWSIFPQDKDHVLFDGWTYPAGAGHPYYGAAQPIVPMG